MSPWTTPIPVLARSINLAIDRNTLDGPTDITAAPTFPRGVDGQEIAVCNVSPYPMTFHDGRAGPNRTGLVLDCEPGGTVSLASGQIMMLYFSISGSMNGKWTQRGAITTAVPRLSSLAPARAGGAGGDSITIHGTNLANATVYVGSKVDDEGSPLGTVTPNMNTPTSVTFTTPPRKPGHHNVLVTTTSGASNVLSIEVRQPSPTSDSRRDPEHERVAPAG